MANVLKMIERYSDISFVSSLRILVRMLFGSDNFLGLNLEIILIISSFVQGEMKNESWLGGKYSENLLYEMAPLLNFRCYRAEETIKSVCNCSRISNNMAFKTNNCW